jgi:enamine deaminase RidA (YjgF/YER057c/UK114 family)
MRPGLAVPARQVFARSWPRARRRRPRHVAEITIYVAGHRHQCRPAIDAPRAGLFADHKPAVAVVGVKTLARPEYLTDVRAIAAIGR